MIFAGPPRKTNGMKLRQGGLMDQPLPPVTAAEVRSAALTVCEILGPNRDAVRETLMALGIDRESLHRGMFYAPSGAPHTHVGPAPFFNDVPCDGSECVA